MNSNAIFPALLEDYSDIIIRMPFEDTAFPLSASRLVNRINSDLPTVSQAVNEQYSIFYVPLSEQLSTVEEAGYSSVPKLFTEINVVSLEATGILSVRIQPFLELSGKGILTGFLDSGIDYTHPAFRSPDGTTRIVRLWDQGDTRGTPPNGIFYGTEYTKEDINRALFSGPPLLNETAPLFSPDSSESLSENNASPPVPRTDSTGHGTAVAGIACGSPDAGEGFTGAAPESAIAFVKLKPAKQYLRDYFRIPDDAVAYQEDDLMVGIRYLIDCAEQLEMPLVICLSLGTNQGGHTGNTPLENVLETASMIPGVCAVAGTGNETGLAHHVSGQLPDPGSGATADIELLVDQASAGFSIEFWTDSPVPCALGFTSPLGETFPPILPDVGASRDFSFLLERSRIILTGALTGAPFLSRVILLRFLDPTPGIWKIHVAPADSASDDTYSSGFPSLQEISGNDIIAIDDVIGAKKFHIWLPISGLVDPGIRFTSPDADTTLVVPSCAPSVLSVGSWNAYENSLYPYSGRGYTRNGLVKPDFVSPGVRLSCPAVGGSYSSITGSCAASALTAGAAALLLESGLMQEPPRYFSAEDIKNLFLRGTLIKNNQSLPDQSWGYGVMNVSNVFQSFLGR
ncbi:MAG: S8 family peptidase [Clostridiales bacterium]|nr:S8 family peptidase [Clostridiales bacterium]